jgi:hypothetical protein
VKRATGILLGLWLFAVNAEVNGAEIRIDPGSCATGGVHLFARDARLSDVLERLAESLGFQLRFEGISDSLVNMDAVMPAPQLVAKLSPVDSVIVSQTRDPDCPHQYRVVKVWLLAKATGASAGSVVRSETAQEKARRLDELSRQAREQYELYVRTHGGKAPPGVDEDAAKSK